MKATRLTQKESWRISQFLGENGYYPPPYVDVIASEITKRGWGFALGNVDGDNEPAPMTATIFTDPVPLGDDYCYFDCEYWGAGERAVDALGRALLKIIDPKVLSDAA